jgi:hypothetical protein
MASVFVLWAWASTPIWKSEPTQCNTTMNVMKILNVWSDLWNIDQERYKTDTEIHEMVLCLYPSIESSDDLTVDIMSYEQLIWHLQDSQKTIGNNLIAKNRVTIQETKKNIINWWDIAIFLVDRSYREELEKFIRDSRVYTEKELGEKYP